MFEPPQDDFYDHFELCHLHKNLFLEWKYRVWGNFHQPYLTIPFRILCMMNKCCITAMSYECQGIAIHCPFDFLLKNLLILTTKKLSKLCITVPLWGESTCHQWIPLQRDSNIESIYLSWCHHDIKACLSGWPLTLTVCFTQHISCRYSHSMRCNMDPGSIPAIQDPDMLYAGITDWPH